MRRAAFLWFWLGMARGVLLAIEYTFMSLALPLVGIADLCADGAAYIKRARR